MDKGRKAHRGIWQTLPHLKESRVTRSPWPIPHLNAGYRKPV